MDTDATVPDSGDPGRHRHPPTVGIVLAGGRARRLGAAAAASGGGKAAVDHGGRTFLDRVATAVAAAVDAVIVVAPAGRPLPAVDGVRVVHDAEPGAGPLAGIRDGLEEAARHWPEAALACVVSCDVPLLRPAVVRLLVAAAADSAAAWTVPVVQGHRQVLLSVLRTDLLPRIEAWLATGRRDLRGLCEQVARDDPRGVRELAAAELVAVDPALDSFLDVDTPDDLERLRRR